MEMPRVVRVAEDRRLRDHGHVVLEGHRSRDGVVDEHLRPDEDAAPHADAAAPMQRRTRGRRQRRIAGDDVQPAFAHRADEVRTLRLRAHRDVAPQLLEHPARLRAVPAKPYWIRKNGRYSVRSIAAGCGSWSWRQIVWLRTTFCRAIVQRSND